jgi:hypothetical protein
VPYPAIPSDEITRLSTHHVIVPVLGPGDADIELPPLDSAAVTAILKGLGIADRAADEGGRIARMSLMALRRRLAVNPELQQPAWAGTPVPRNVRRALLASRWNENSEGDRSVISDMLGIPYEDIAEEVNARLAEGDPLLTRTSAAI